MTYSTGAVLGVSTTAVLALTGVPFNYLLIGFSGVAILLAVGFAYDTYFRKN